MALVDILTYHVENYIFFAASALVLLVLMIRNDRQTWITIDTIASVGFGLAFAFLPETILNMEVSGELDDATITVVRVFGMTLISTAVVLALTRETLDGTVPITLISARLFSYAVIFLALVYTHFGTNKGKKNVNWRDQDVYFSMGGTLLTMIGDFYFLVRSHDFSSYPQYHIRINEFLRVDALLSLLLAVLLLAFPDLVLKHFFPSLKVHTCVQLHFTRCIGGFALNLAMISLQAPGFLHERDKRSHFTGRIVSYVFMFLPLVYGALVNSQFTLRQIEWALLVTAPILVNGVLGYIAGGTIRYTFRPSTDKTE